MALDQVSVLSVKRCIAVRNLQTPVADEGGTGSVKRSCPPGNSSQWSPRRPIPPPTPVDRILSNLSPHLAYLAFMLSYKRWHASPDLRYTHLAQADLPSGPFGCVGYQTIIKLQRSKAFVNACGYTYGFICGIHMQIRGS